VMIGWVFFRAENLAKAVDFLGNMVGIGSHAEPGRYSLSLWLDPVLATSLAAAVIAATPVLPAALRRFGAAARPAFVVATAETAALLALAAMFVVSCTLMASGSYNPFIYFRF
ncbi:MAG TPA: hypothetical protein VFA35_03975, partial [Burkholderiaceae bacterium]|nr:hypothetical protein [Burkholderiaceae bacterium]